MSTSSSKEHDSPARERSRTGGFKPEILAPAGDAASFLAALAAGADAVYVGLKSFSARMQAANFSVSDLARCTSLAHERGARVYLALNTLIKPNELDNAGRLVDRASRTVSPDALIVQDLGSLNLARQAGFRGELHLSTLAALSHPAGLAAAKAMGADRVVLPRELSVDEMRIMADACPPGLDLEVFIHGALCFCVSGRCWWSSYLGGKSGLRGRCVQPCRRVYKQRNHSSRSFSCLDLGLDVLVKPLLAMENIRTWKIEGRKKGPHYVFYTVTAYRMLRDNFQDAAARKEAQALLERALGRRTTHYGFLPQRSRSPVAAAEDSLSGSGLLVGKVGLTPEGRAYVKPRFPLLPRDFLRIGHEDERGHATYRVTKQVPKGGRLDLRFPAARGMPRPSGGTPVFLMDRREPELIKLLQKLEKELEAQGEFRQMSSSFEPAMPEPWKPRPKERPLPQRMTLVRSLAPGKATRRQGLALWLAPKTLNMISKTLYSRVSWWLPPVIWPEEEHSWRESVVRAARSGANTFVLGAPWQIALLEGVKDTFAVAGPFCNVANALAVEALAKAGFSAAVAAPELDSEALLSLPKSSPLPMAALVKGWWPVGISRAEPFGLKPNQPFDGPKQETFWHLRHGSNTWIYPSWPLDLSARAKDLQAAGYVCLMEILEHTPASLTRQDRASEFNWDLRLL